MAEHELYYDPDDIFDSPENAGISGSGIERTVRRVAEAGATYRVIDASELTRAEAEDACQRLAVPPSVRQRYRVRGVFGTNKYSGGSFGKGVPALVVLENGRPKDSYPHQEQDGTVVTINDYLDRLDNSGAALVARMDALRERIGKIGATASSSSGSSTTRIIWSRRWRCAMISCSAKRSHSRRPLCCTTS